MSKRREDLLAETLDQASQLAPLMNVIVEQIEAEPKSKPKSKKRRPNSGLFEND